MKKKCATEKSVKFYEKIIREKDAMEKAVKYYGKARREKRLYRKTCEKTRKYPNQIVHQITKKIKYYYKSKFFRIIIRTFPVNYPCNSVENKDFHAHFSQCIKYRRRKSLPLQYGTVFPYEHYGTGSATIL
jgi:hypothetical protein